MRIFSFHRRQATSGYVSAAQMETDCSPCLETDNLVTFSPIISSTALAQRPPAKFQIPNAEHEVT